MAGVMPAPLCSLREPRHKGERGVSCGCRGGGRPSRETGPPGPTPGPAGAHRAPGRGCCGLRQAWRGQRAPAQADVPATAPGSGLRPVCAKALGSEAPGPAREPRFPGAASGQPRGRTSPDPRPHAGSSAPAGVRATPVCARAAGVRRAPARRGDAEPERGRGSQVLPGAAAGSGRLRAAPVRGNAGAAPGALSREGRGASACARPRVRVPVCIRVCVCVCAHALVCPRVRPCVCVEQVLAMRTACSFNLVDARPHFVSGTVCPGKPWARGACRAASPSGDQPR